MGTAVLLRPTGAMTVIIARKYSYRIPILSRQTVDDLANAADIPLPPQVEGEGD